MSLTETYIVLAVGLVLLLARRRCAREASWMHERLSQMPLDPEASEFGFTLGGCAYLLVGLIALFARF